MVSVVIIALLVRSGRAAWRNRWLALLVWRRIRPRHLLGSAVLLVGVVGFAYGLVTLIPVTSIGLGTPLGLTGNAVFAPLEEVNARVGGGTLRGGGDAPLGADGGLVALAGIFLLALLGMFPWLAYVEERVFRVGLETAGPWREAWTALRFGLVHLLMLIPLAAALAIGLAGFAYGRIYRRAYRRAAQQTMQVRGPLGVPLAVPVPPLYARDDAVLAATVWHTTFNSLIVLLVLALLLMTA